ncbi:MAG: hypothetical protein ABR541_01945 [Candidatus Dormibacteria bacterium]
MRRHLPAGAVLVLGGGIAAVVGRRQHDLPEVVLVLGLSLLAAWLIERGRRFGPSGAVITGLGAGLALAEHAAGSAPYRDELIFGGIALGILLAVQLVHGPLRGAGVALLSVALFEAALQALPAHLSAPRLYSAFEQGWAFGLLLAVEGTLVAFGLGKRRTAIPRAGQPGVRQPR